MSSVRRSLSGSWSCRRVSASRITSAGRDGYPFKLRLCSDPPDPLMLLRGQRCGDLVVGLRSARDHASSLTSGHLDGKSLSLQQDAAPYEGSARAFHGYGPRMRLKAWAAGEAERLLRHWAIDGSTSEPSASAPTA